MKERHVYGEMKCQFCDEHSYEMEILKKHMKESHAACKLPFYLLTAVTPRYASRDT